MSVSATDTPAPATTIATTTTVASSTTPSTTPGAPQQVSVQTLTVGWVASGARGLPAEVGGSLLLPVDIGLSVFNASSGPAAGDSAAPAKTIVVNRNGYTGRVDAAAIATAVIETRGNQVVALR